MANENDEERIFEIHICIAEMQGNNVGKFFTKVATKKKLIYYCEHEISVDAAKDYQRLLQYYGFVD